jgi:hypothetical protein
MGGVEGILVHRYNPSKSVGVNEFFSFFTNVNKTYYVIMAGAKKEITPDLKKEIDRYLSSAKKIIAFRQKISKLFGQRSRAKPRYRHR